MLPSLRMFVSTAIMQFLSAGEWSLREETHARDNQRVRLTVETIDETKMDRDPYLELCAEGATRK